MSAPERLREVREFFHLNQREFGEKIGVSSQLISQMENSKTPVSYMTARVIETVFGVSSAWLLKGTGEMVLPNRKPGVTAPDLIPALKYYPAVTEALNRVANYLTLGDWESLNSLCIRINMQQKEGDKQDG